MKKIFYSKKGEGYVEVCISALILITLALIILNLFELIMLRVSLGQTADDLITVACYSGGFTDEFWECDSVHVDEYMYYDIDYGADRYFDSSEETVQLGDSMWVEVSAGIDVKGAGAFKIPMTVSVKRFGISERYLK